MNRKVTIDAILRVMLFLLTIYLVLPGFFRESDSTADAPGMPSGPGRLPGAPGGGVGPRPAGSGMDASGQNKPTPQAPALSEPLELYTPLSPRTPTEPVKTEALARVGVSEYHAHGDYGEGVKIAVIDDQYEGLVSRIDDEELPRNVITQHFLTDGTVRNTVTAGEGPHGVACAEIIYDIAPQAQLYLIQVDDLAGNLPAVLDYLYSEGVRIVSISMSTTAQGRGDGQGALGSPPAPVYEILDDARNDRNMLVIKSAGNSARQHYSGTFTDTDGNAWHEFGEAQPAVIDEDLDIHIKKDAEVRLYLTWDDWGNDPLHPAAAYDYDLYLYDDKGQEVRRSAQVQAGDLPPLDVITFVPSSTGTYHIKIRKARDFPQNHQLNLFVRGDVPALGEYQVKNGSLGAPADARSVIAVAAANVANDTLASYSSQGPTADGRIKPDVTSYAYVSVTTPDFEQQSFYGTSAAAPHVAGMAALLASLPGNADLTADALADLLLSFAADKGEPGKDNRWGVGIAQLPPLGTNVMILAPSAVSPDLAHDRPHPDRAYIEVMVGRSDGSPISGLLRDAFRVQIGGQESPLVTVRNVGYKYILESRLPLQLTGGLYDLTVTALGASGAVTEAVQLPEAVGEFAAQVIADPAFDVAVDTSFGYRTGDAIGLQASLSNRGPIEAARITARVVRPRGAADTLILYDDGMHGDGVANDGVYGGFYTRTTDPGAYRFEVTASGVSPAGRPFEKQFELSIPVVAGADDSDGDGLPDNWEKLMGLDSTTNDAYRDQDGDGLINLDEYRNGTDPYNWDTDDDTLNDGAEVDHYYAVNPTSADTDLGGVDDAAELRNGTNPLDPTDDDADRHIVYLPPLLRTYQPSPKPINRAVAEGDSLWIATKAGVIHWHRTDESYVKYTTVDGLVNNTVNAIAIDRAGRKWFGTEAGVSVFDGATWRTYTVADGLTGDRVRAIAVDPAGNLWFGTAGGVSKFDGAAWTPYTVNDGLASNDVYAIAIDEAGRLWIGTRHGVSEFDGATWTSYTTADGLAHEWVTAVAVDGAGHKWFGTWGGGASEFVETQPDPATPTGTPSSTWTTYGIRSGLRDQYVYDITADEAGRLWFRTYQGVREFYNEQWTRYSTDIAMVGGLAHGLPKDAIYAITPDERGREWFDPQAVERLPDAIRITMDERKYKWFGAYRRQETRPGGTLSDTWITYATDVVWSDSPTPNSNAVYAVAVDAAGRAWFGSDSSVTRLDGDAWTTYHIHGELARNRVHAIVVDRAGAVWIGTDGGGASKFDGQEWTTYLPANGLVSAYINAIAIDGAGRLWFGSGDGHGGVSVFDGESWTNYTYDDGLASCYVNAIAVDTLGNLWFGTDMGVSRFDGTTWTTFTVDEGLADNRVYAVIVDPTGQLWFGAAGGVSRFDGATWTTYTAADGLANACVRAIAVDEAGNLWFGTCGGGVSRFDGDAWTTYTTDDGLAGNDVWAIATDAAGHKWFGTDNGASVLVTER